MINCFIDPIFLANSENISTKYYSEVIFPILYEFCNKIEDLEKHFNKRGIKFNITFDLILLSMKFNPYRFRSTISCSRWFKKFLSYFLKQHRNSKCDIISIDQSISHLYRYENNNVPHQIMEDWNSFLNKCSNCSYINERNLDLLTFENLGAKKVKDFPDFFNANYSDLISWINNQMISCMTYSKPPIVKIQPRLKKKGDWKHSKTKLILKEIDKILKCDYVSEVRPISKTRQMNKNLIEFQNSRQIRLYIKDELGSQIFILKTTAQNDAENRYIIKKLAEILPNFEIK